MFYFNSPGQISQLSWAPPYWRVWLEFHSGPCDSADCRWFVKESAAYWGDLSPTAVTTECSAINLFRTSRESIIIIITVQPFLLRLSKYMISWYGCTNLCHVSDQVEGDIRESFVKISTHHVDPREAVSCVGVRFIQSHDMREVGELGVLLLKAYLHTKSALP